ncbi:hypothetical protein AB0F96_05705 [Streptomyces sp. NPDC023998]|uniref:hypothetical protein n=1 Tax=Streptomyces sp. NPDC023998 TaxID=3154597 RepID=UPI0034018742
MIADDLQRENDQLKEKVRQLQTGRRQLRKLTKRFARVFHVREVENPQLREHSLR